MRFTVISHFVALASLAICVASLALPAGQEVDKRDMIDGIDAAINFEPREVAAIEANTEDFALQEVDLAKRQLAVGARIVVTWLVDLFGAGAKQAIYEIAESAAAGVITRTAGAAVSGVTRTAEAIGFTAIFDDGFLTMAARVTVTLRDGVVKTVLNSATRSGSSESIAKFIDISGQLLAPR